ncbi:MAG: NHLP bacteriocin export ABC transporter permease/ATPase subunit, partial [Thermotaleaceae bacterium]
NKILKVKDLLKFGLESSWKRDILMILLMGLAGGLLGMLIPVATGIIFNSVIPGGEKAQLLQVGFLLAAIAVADFLFQLTRSFAMLRMEGKMDGSIQAAVWDRLLSLPAPFFKDYTSGELAMRAMSITEIRRILSGVTITTMLTSIFSIFNFGLLFYYDKKLALIASIPVIISILITLGLGYYQIRYERQLIHISNKIHGLVLQLLAGVGKFRVAGAERRAFYQWVKEFSFQRKIAFKGKLIANWLKTFNSFFPMVTSIIIFYFVINATQSNLEPGKFIAFNAALGTFIAYMTSLSQALLTVNAIVPMYETTKPILETLPEYDETKDDAGELTGEIEVNHVSFRYKKNGPLVIQDVSLRIKEGEYVALVGSSGSGKSTLFRILLGFEKPENGQIYYNGMDMSKVNIRSIRKQLGVVLQNGQLMSGDIFTNIIGSNPNLTIEDAWTAAKMAGLDKDIERMPMGMHTVISEGGSTLSGGQRQRLLIARAIVNRPRIIYFDEATSALDNQTQKIVSDSLDNLSATRIVIAHRLSTIMNCHRIIVLDRGRIVEEGSYQELMGKNGTFSELAKRQLA